MFPRCSLTTSECDDWTLYYQNVDCSYWCCSNQRSHALVWDHLRFTFGLTQIGLFGHILQPIATPSCIWDNYYSLKVVQHLTVFLMPITIKCWNSTTNIIDSIIFKLFLLSLIILFEFCNWVGVDLVFGRLLFRKWVCLPVLPLLTLE